MEVWVYLTVCGWGWDLLSSGLFVLSLADVRPRSSPLLAAAPTCGCILAPRGLGLGDRGVGWPSLFGCLSCLVLSGIGCGASVEGLGGARARKARVLHSTSAWVAGGLAGQVGCRPLVPGLRPVVLNFLYPELRYVYLLLVLLLFVFFCCIFFSLFVYPQVLLMVLCLVSPQRPEV